MASGKRHLLGGLVFVWFFLTILANFFFIPSIEEILVYTSLALIFALWPDIDIKSLGQRVFYLVFFVTDALLIFVFQAYKIAAFFGLLLILPVLAKHRGWTHSKLTAILLPLPLMGIPLYLGQGTLAEGIPYYLAAVTGYFSHLFFDKTLFK